MRKEELFPKQKKLPFGEEVGSILKKYSSISNYFIDVTYVYNALLVPSLIYVIR